MSLDAARTSVPYCVPHKDCDENGFDPAAVEVVARTGYGEAVRVFDLGPRNETISRGPGDRIARRTCEGDCNHETGPLPQAITRRPTWKQDIGRLRELTFTKRCWRW